MPKCNKTTFITLKHSQCDGSRDLIALLKLIIASLRDDYCTVVINARVFNHICVAEWTLWSFSYCQSITLAFNVLTEKKFGEFMPSLLLRTFSILDAVSKPSLRLVKSIRLFPRLLGWQ